MRSAFCLLLVLHCGAALNIGTPARPHRAAPRTSPVQLQLQFPWDKKPSSKSDEAIAFKDPDALTEEEERKLKLEIGTNWRPRTSTKAGEGYLLPGADTEDRRAVRHAGLLFRRDALGCGRARHRTQGAHRGWWCPLLGPRGGADHELSPSHLLASHVGIGPKVL